MKPTQGRLKRIGISPIKPRKLTKKDIYPTVNEKIEQNDEKLSDKEENEIKDPKQRRSYHKTWK